MLTGIMCRQAKIMDPEKDTGPTEGDTAVEMQKQLLATMQGQHKTSIKIHT